MKKKYCIYLAFLFIAFSNTVNSTAFSLLPKRVIIEGCAISLQDGDSIDIRGFRYGIRNFDSGIVIIKGASVVKGNYHITIDQIDIPMCFDITYYRNAKVIGSLTGGLFTEPGDSIHIEDKGTPANLYNKIFSGKGAQKTSCYLYLLSQNEIFSLRYPNLTTINRDRVKTFDSLCQEELQYINTFKGRISQYAFNYLRCTALLFCEQSKYLAFNIRNVRSPFPFQNKQFQAEIEKMALDPQSGMEYFGAQSYYISVKYHYDSAASLQHSDGAKQRYLHIKNNYRGPLREVLITDLLNNVHSTDLSFCVGDALHMIKNPIFRRILVNISNTTGIGQRGYNFSLQDTSGQLHRLSDFRDSIVVLDFWFTGCGNCRQLKPFLDTIEQQFAGSPVKFISVSTDTDQDRWKRSIVDGKYTSGITLNLWTNGIPPLDAPIIKQYNIFTYPTLVLIDKKGHMANTPVDPRLDRGKDIKYIINNLLEGN